MNHLQKSTQFLLLGLVLAASCLLSAPWLEANLPLLCLSKRVLGLSCPGCGMTRAFASIGHGQWEAAWNYNPLAFPFYAFVAALWLRLGAQLGAELWKRHSN